MWDDNDDDAREENGNPEAYRNAWSGRGYLGFSRDWGAHAEIAIRPYWRSNSMTFLQHYLPWQATESNRHQSLGLQAIANGLTGKLTWLAGIDVDHTQGSLLETQAEFFSPNQPDGVHYDYEVATATLATLLRGLAGSQRQPNARPDNEAMQPLQLWGYEPSPFVRPVREKLCALCLPHTLVPTARGSANRDALVRKTGVQFQVPYLVDPNTGVELFESPDILDYLEEVYTVEVAGTASPFPIMLLS